MDSEYRAGWLPSRHKLWHLIQKCDGLGLAVSLSVSQNQNRAKARRVERVSAPSGGSRQWPPTCTPFILDLRVDI